MADRNPPDPFPAFNFIVKIDDVTLKTGFSECSGISMESDPIEYRNGDEKFNSVRKLGGLAKFGNITLKRGFTQNAKELWEWRKKVIDGKTKDARTNGSITLLDEAREPALQWDFEDAWPRKLDGPTFNAKTNEAAIETLEIVVERIKLV